MAAAVKYIHIFTPTADSRKPGLCVCVKVWPYMQVSGLFGSYDVRELG